MKAQEIPENVREGLSEAIQTLQRARYEEKRHENLVVRYLRLVPWSQARIAIMVGVTPQFFSLVLSGQRGITPKLLAGLAETFIERRR